MIYVCHTVNLMNNSIFGEHHKADFRLVSEDKVLGIISLFSQGPCPYEKGKKYDVSIQAIEDK